MTRRKPYAALVKPQPPNPANIARKLFRIRQEIFGILDGIDGAIARLKVADENAASILAERVNE